MTASDSVLPSKSTCHRGGSIYAYSTNNTKLDLGFTSLSQIEEDCPTLNKYYSGSGLLVYDDDIYETTVTKGKVEYLILLSIYFDSNIASAFRIWENGGKVSDPRFYQLLEYVKRRNLSFDYSFFILERMTELMNTQNTHPFETIRALKQFDYATIKETDNGLLVTPSLDNGEAGRLATETMSYFARQPWVQESIVRQKSVYLIMLKAYSLYLMNKKSIDQNLCALTKFCLDKIGRFAKTELYFAWKFFKYRTKFNFFSPINSLTPKSLKALRGMCWDLFFLRHQETITSAVPTDGFSVPFMSSLDNKFVELTKACPIRCTLMDLEYDKMHTLYEDEFEFAEDLNAALSDSLKSEITNPIAAKLRAQRPLTTETTIDQEIETLSAELAC